MEINSFSGNFHTVISLLNKTAEYLTHHCPDTPRLDAEVLLAHVLKTDKTGLFLSFQNLIAEKERKQLQKLVSQRIRREPVSYIIGRKEFWSLSFRVNPAVMIPRPQTETLVEATIKIFPSGSSPSMLEIGTGSGAISIALATELPGASITATDLSLEALSVARENAAANGVNTTTFLEGNLFDPLETGGGNFDLIISNPPYIPTEEISRLPAGIRDYEPYIAFDGGLDGLEYYRKIASDAHYYLKIGGYLLLEVGDKQSHEVSQIISRSEKFSSPETLRDLSGTERVVKAYRV